MAIAENLIWPSAPAPAVAPAAPARAETLVLRIYFLMLAILGLAALVLNVENRLTPDLFAIAPPVDLLPPLSDQAWFGAFTVHQQDPVFAACGGSENLAQFKVLYWWEWLRRASMLLVAGSFAFRVLHRRAVARLPFRLAAPRRARPHRARLSGGRVGPRAGAPACRRSSALQYRPVPPRPRHDLRQRRARPRAGVRHRGAGPDLFAAGASPGPCRLGLDRTYCSRHRLGRAVCRARCRNGVARLSGLRDGLAAAARPARRLYAPVAQFHLQSIHDPSGASRLVDRLVGGADRQSDLERRPPRRARWGGAAARSRDRPDGGRDRGAQARRAGGGVPAARAWRHRDLGGRVRGPDVAASQTRSEPLRRPSGAAAGDGARDGAFSSGASLRQIIAMHPGAWRGGRFRLHEQGPAAVAHLDAAAGPDILLDARRVVRGGQKARRLGDRRWRRHRIALAAVLGDGLGHAGDQELRPHLPEQAVRGIDVGAAELAVDGEHVAHDVVVLLAERPQRLDVVRLGALEATVFQRQLEAGAGGRRRDRRAETVRKLALDFAHALPDLALSPAHALRFGAAGLRGRDSGQLDLGGARGQRRIGAGELRNVLAAARRPAALLDAERGDRDRPGMGLQQQADAEHAVLLPALHDIAGLNEDLFAAGVLDLQFVDLSELAHHDGLLGERLGERQRDRAAARLAVHEIDRKVAVHGRTGQAVVVAGVGMRGGAGELRQAERYAGE